MYCACIQSSFKKCVAALVEPFLDAYSPICDRCSNEQSLYFPCGVNLR